ncbi:phage tail protein [Bradyrhizobium macuxiense]|uniref:Phage tail protein n=1 Tax=Bradyrhizobium macuxiense TaxID=1755647 RepID=A0A120FHR7_9BRAD|nr:tail fiber protein [Bradyrhizobium macuxiense]KWV46309.1 phage tail protein [Bradyrhizobium macuxiense]
MSDPFLGEIRMFGGNFAPAGWATCDGQLLPISGNDALFTLIGTTYGGDGQNTFALPNLAARIPIHSGQGTGLSPYVLGQLGGTPTVTLTTGQIPFHNHNFMASTANGGQASPQNAFVASPTAVKEWLPHPAVAAMNAASILNTGGGQPHENMMPYLVVTFIIALTGIFPTQS